MIKYQLACQEGHGFEGWFQGSDAFDRQVSARQLACPVCGTQSVEKAVMAPGLVKRREARPAERLEDLRRIRAAIERRSDYVGSDFAAEARRIHLEQAEPRAIYGEATRSEVKGLLEDGVPVLPMPTLPEEQN